MKKLVIFLIPLLFSCAKDQKTDPQPTGVITISLNHKANGQTALFDTIMYQIPSGFDLSLTRWEYYLSGFSFMDESGKVVYSKKDAHYVNGRYADTWDIVFTGVPTGHIKKVKFSIGLIEEINISGGLPNTPENIGMAWPDVMGGGYHFMKLEGHFQKTPPSAGYAMHMGDNGYQVHLEFPLEFNLTTEGINIEADIDAMQWFTNPYNFDFDIDGNYTMGIPELMQKLTDNGSTVITKIEVQ